MPRRPRFPVESQDTINNDDSPFRMRILRRTVRSTHKGGIRTMTRIRQVALTLRCARHNDCYRRIAPGYTDRHSPGVDHPDRTTPPQSPHHLG